MMIGTITTMTNTTTIKLPLKIIEEIDRQVTDLMNRGFTPNLIEMTQESWEYLKAEYSAYLQILKQPEDEFKKYGSVDTVAGNIPFFISTMGVPVAVHAYHRSSPVWTNGLQTDVQLKEHLQKWLDDFIAETETNNGV